MSEFPDVEAHREQIAGIAMRHPSWTAATSEGNDE